MQKTTKNIAREIAAASGAMRAPEIFDTLVEALFCACVLSAPGEAALLEQHAARARMVFAKLEKAGMSAERITQILEQMNQAITRSDGDFLGDLAAEIGTLDGRLGQFFTPFEVSRLLAKMQLDETQVRQLIREHGHVSIGEPAAGAGGMLLAAAARLRELDVDVPRQLFCEATELERAAYHMCYVQLSLREIPARVIHGNCLTLERGTVLYTPAYFHFFLPFQAERAKWKDLFSLAA